VRRRRTIGLWCGALWLSLCAGCVAPEQGDDPAAPEWSDLRLAPVAAERGLVLDLPPRPARVGSFGGGVVAEDLDGDGDIDVSYVDLWGRATVYANDGLATFEPTVVSEGFDAATPPQIATHAAVHVVGDRLPDLVLTGWNRVWVLENLGDLAFAERRPLTPPLTDSHLSVFASIAPGDADGDGDLDLFLPGLGGIHPDDDLRPGGLDLLLWNDGGTFDTSTVLGDPELPSQSFAGAWTDRDLDGDLDLLVTSVSDGHVAQGTSWYDNHGSGLSDPEPMDMAGFASPMGIARADIDGDGLPDYCLADMGPTPCFVQSEDGWTEQGIARGLYTSSRQRVIGWSLVFDDLDNDGVVDGLMAGGHSAASYRAVAEGWLDHSDYVEEHPDTVWFGRRGDGLRFVDGTAAYGFGDLSDHYGAAAADFDGDGGLDLVLVGNEDPAELWLNAGTGRSWLEVELDGPDSNPQGFGARVSVLTEDGWQEREISGPAGYGQGPSRAHFGLEGDEQVHTIEVVWPGGAVSTVDGVEARRVVTIPHP
jgi:enediyne biosynthesis protein E4